MKRVHALIAVLLVMMLTTLTGAAQTMRIASKSGNYKLYGRDGRPLCNYVLDQCEILKDRDLAKVRVGGDEFIITPDGYSLSSVISDNIEMYDKYFLAKDYDASETSVIDYEGRVLLGRMNMFFVSRDDGKTKSIDGREMPLFKGCEMESDPVYFYGLDLRPIGPTANMKCHGNAVMIWEEYGKYGVFSLAGEEILPREFDYTYDRVLRALVPYSKAPKSIKSKYSKDEYDRLFFYEARKGRVTSLYCLDGTLICSIPHKTSYLTDKDMLKSIKKKVLPLYANKDMLMDKYQQRLGYAFDQIYSGTPLGCDCPAPKLTVKLDKILSCYFFHVFPPLAEADEAEKNEAEEKKLGKLLVSNKHGKVKRFKRRVENDGNIFYELCYQNDSYAILDCNGKIFLGPTKKLIVYHHDQTFAFYNGDTQKTEQIYDYNGKLIYDIEKSKYDEVHLHRLDQLVWLSAKRDEKVCALDYFGVQLTPCIYPDLICYDKSGDGKPDFIACMGDKDYVDTGYTLPSTSYRGGKASPARKFPANASVPKSTTASTSTSTTSSSSSTVPASSAPVFDMAQAKKELRRQRTAKIFGALQVVGSVALNTAMAYQSAKYATSSSGEGSYSSSSSSSGSSSGEGHTCPSCKGKKYGSTSYSMQPTHSGTVRAPYHNSGGSCPYCSSSGDHWHSACPRCGGKGIDY